MIVKSEPSAASAIITLLLRTRIGETYYKALESWRYLGYTIGLMLSASIGNLLLTGAAKYALILAVIALACWLFRRELNTLWTTALQLLRSLMRKKEAHK